MLSLPLLFCYYIIFIIDYSKVQESKNRISLKNFATNLLKNEGIRAFWKGNTAGIFLYASYNSIQFSTLNYLNHQFSSNSFINGGLAALTATTLTYPFDLLRTRMTISKGITGIVKELKNILRETEGPKGLFKGYFLTIGQVFPYMGCIFTTHKYIKNQGGSDLFAGASAGLVCKTIFMPFDVLRRRLQLFKTNPDQFCIDCNLYSTSKNRIELIKLMWKREGLKVFFRGWSMAVIKSTPVTAITFSVHQFIRDRI